MKRLVYSAAQIDTLQKLSALNTIEHAETARKTVLRLAKLNEPLSDSAPVAQLDRAVDFESTGREFEPLRARQKALGTVE